MAINLNEYRAQGNLGLGAAPCLHRTTKWDYSRILSLPDAEFRDFYRALMDESHGGTLRSVTQTFQCDQCKGEIYDFGDLRRYGVFTFHSPCFGVFYDAHIKGSPGLDGEQRKYWARVRSVLASQVI